MAEILRPLSKKERRNLETCSEIIEGYIRSISIDFSKESIVKAEELAEKIKGIANLLMRIYPKNREIKQIMSQIIIVLTGNINPSNILGKIERLEDLNKQFINHIKMGYYHLLS